MNTRKWISLAVLGAMALVAALLLGRDGSERGAGLQNRVQEAPSDTVQAEWVPSVEGERGARSTAETGTSEPQIGIQAEPTKPTAPNAPEFTLAAGQIRVRCLGEGWEGAVAMVAPSIANFMRPTEAEPAEQLAPLHLASAGLSEVSFHGLRSGNWSVGVRDSNQVEIWTHVRLAKSPDPGEAVEFGRGGSGVRGKVYGPAGSPLEGVIIALDIPLPDGGKGRATTRTNPIGAYEVGGIMAGGGWFTATQYGDSEQAHVRLASHVMAFPDDAWAKINVGSPQGSGRLIASFVNSVGEPLRGGNATAIRTPGGERISQKLGADGLAHFDLPSGEWKMRLWGLDGRHPVQGTIQVQANQVTEHVFQVEGARIGGFVRNGLGTVLSPVPAKQQVSLRESPVGYIFRSAKVQPDGSYRFNGVDPGTYYLTMWPVSAPTEYKVTITEANEAVDQDLQSL